MNIQKILLFALLAVANDLQASDKIPKADQTKFIRVPGGIAGNSELSMSVIIGMKKDAQRKARKGLKRRPSSDDCGKCLEKIACVICCVPRGIHVIWSLMRAKP